MKERHQVRRLLHCSTSKVSVRTRDGTTYPSCCAAFLSAFSQERRKLVIVPIIRVLFDQQHGLQRLEGLLKVIPVFKKLATQDTVIIKATATYQNSVPSLPRGS